jgi:hypothetical protein
MTTAEERAELLRISRELINELRALTSRVRQLIGNLDSASDDLLPQAVDEREQVPTVRRIVVRATPAVAHPPRDTSPTGRKRRTCRACGQTGHWATSPKCPKAKRTTR